MLPLVYAYIPHYFISFDCCPRFPPSAFFSRCVSHSLSLFFVSLLIVIVMSGLSSAAYRTMTINITPFLRSLLWRRMFFLTQRILCACLLFVFLFLGFFICLLGVSSWRRRFLLLLLSVSFCLCFPCFFSPVSPVWFAFVRCIL